MIQLSNLNRKGNIPKIPNSCIIGMTSHHSRPSQLISHHSSKMIYSIPTCTITSNKNPIIIYKTKSSKTLYKKLNKLRDVWFPPHVTGFLSWSNGYPYCSLWKQTIVQVLMVTVLLLVYVRSAVATAMKTKDQAITIDGLLTKNKIRKTHSLSLIWLLTFLQRICCMLFTLGLNLLK